MSKYFNKKICGFNFWLRIIKRSSYNHDEFIKKFNRDSNLQINLNIAKNDILPRQLIYLLYHTGIITRSTCYNYLGKFQKLDGIRYKFFEDIRIIIPSSICMEQYNLLTSYLLNNGIQTIRIESFGTIATTFCIKYNVLSKKYMCVQDELINTYDKLDNMNLNKIYTVDEFIHKYENFKKKIYCKSLNFYDKIKFILNIKNARE